MLMTEKGRQAQEMMGATRTPFIARLKLYHEAVGPYCFAWGVASDDAGTQKGELIAPELFAGDGQAPLPPGLRLGPPAHPWKTYLHSCGSIYHYIPHWIEAASTSSTRCRSPRSTWNRSA